MVMASGVNKVHSAAEFPKAVEEWFVKIMSGDRFKLISIKTAPFGSKGSYCSLFDMAQDRKGQSRGSWYCPGNNGAWFRLLRLIVEIYGQPQIARKNHTEEKQSWIRR
jgi:hypothetical protein